ncbi:hypothetical protein [Streptomyces sp. UG1]|uniref:hypothetical protein n=1 Tax=Streptomyces sp. UG1 TaxID=3417652 RepID=UPI003CED97A7
MDGDRLHGTAVSAFASHSLTPLMVLMSLDNRSQLLAGSPGSSKDGDAQGCPEGQQTQHRAPQNRPLSGHGGSARRRRRRCMRGCRAAFGARGRSTARVLRGG